MGAELAGMPEQRGANAIDKSQRRGTENAQQTLGIDEFGKSNCSRSVSRTEGELGWKVNGEEVVSAGNKCSKQVPQEREDIWFLQEGRLI